MENKALFEQVRHKLRDDDVPGALQLLIDQLKSNAAYTDVVRTLRVIDAGVVSTKQRERKGILTYNEALPIYSQAIDSIHGIIDDLEQGRIPQSQQADTAPAPTASSSSRKALVAIFSMVVLVAAGWLLFTRMNRRPVVEPPAAVQLPAPVTKVCPSYLGKGVRVLILPFQAFGGETEKPEIGFQSRIRKRTEDNHFPALVEVYGGALQSNSVPDNNLAAQIGRTCDADLVIWGVFDKQKDALNIEASYVFTQTQRAGKTDFQPVSGLPALTSGSMFRSIDDAVFSICAIMAIREENDTLAMKWLKKITKPNATDARLREFLAADDKPQIRKVQPEIRKRTPALKKAAD